MSYIELFKTENEQFQERYTLSMERIRQIRHEHTVSEPFAAYFRKGAEFILKIDQVVSLTKQEHLRLMTMGELKDLTEGLYRDILPKNYTEGFANPAYSWRVLGKDYGPLLSFLMTELYSLIGCAYESRQREITILSELYIEIYNYFEAEVQPAPRQIQDAIYWYMSDYTDVMVPYRLREQLDPSLDFAKEIIMTADLTDLRYLYYYGEYITANELGMATYLNTLPMSEIQSMADTMTHGYVKGFELKGADLSRKKNVNLRFSLGFERVIRQVILNLKALGLDVTLYRSASQSIHKKNSRIGYLATSPNKQWDYDHRYDRALYLDKAFIDRYTGVYRSALETYKQLAADYAGPACMEVFGEMPFEPESRPQALSLTQKQQKLWVELTNTSAMLMESYMPMSEISFTIIAYPIPEIGSNFEGIFRETVKVNTLDSQRYERIQQVIIDALDKADYVHIQGRNGNRTDLKVNLYKLSNPEKETIFENCVADVNIPVGEVFTSPVLEKTNGILHVSQVYLNELKYMDLEISFEEGMVSGYRCDNFASEAENKDFIKTNVLFNHQTLPMGEFAIGTNTTAYAMAQTYGIMDKLPILIAEKMGPHFAVGDTCYSRSEEQKVFNPDGKEVVARDNCCSLLRYTDSSKAYYNCHTDITLPYSELGAVTAYTVSGEQIEIIKNGRFVLAGTEELNAPLDLLVQE